jgi:transcriptional regulator with XRE-family HTH domain
MESGGPLLRQFRVDRDLSQSHVADVVGISRPYLSQIEAGERTPAVGIVAALCECMGLSDVQRAQVLAAFDDRSSVADGEENVVTQRIPGPHAPQGVTRQDTVRPA